MKRGAGLPFARGPYQDGLQIPREGGDLYSHVNAAGGAREPSGTLFVYPLVAKTVSSTGGAGGAALFSNPYQALLTNTFVSIDVPNGKQFLVTHMFSFLAPAVDQCYIIFYLNGQPVTGYLNLSTISTNSETASFRQTGVLSRIIELEFDRVEIYNAMANTIQVGFLAATGAARIVS